MSRFSQRAYALFLVSVFTALSLTIFVVLLKSGWLAKTSDSDMSQPPSSANTSETESFDLQVLSVEMERANAKIKELEKQLATQADNSEMRKVINELEQALSPYGVMLEVSEINGDITLNQTILYNSNEYELTAGGEEFLNSVLPALVSVLVDPDNIDSIKEFNIVGHINPTGEISDRYKLSLLRALSIAQYILDANYTPLTSQQKERLTPLLKVVGVSSNYPVYRENGLIDNDASRRVEFSVTFNSSFVKKDIAEILSGD